MTEFFTGIEEVKTYLPYNNVWTVDYRFYCEWVDGEWSYTSNNFRTQVEAEKACSQYYWEVASK